MEQVAFSYLARGDAAAAASVFSTLGAGRPKFARLARLTRVVADPASVPFPHRHADMAEAILEPQIPLRAFAGCADTSEKLQKVFQKLLLAVHPDKNPHPRAAEAFIHLQGMKEAFVAIADDVAAERVEQEKQASDYNRLTSCTPPPPPVAKTPAPEKKPQQRPAPKKPSVPKKKQLEHALSSLKAHGSKQLKLQCNLSLSAYEEERKHLQQDSTASVSGDDDDENEDQEETETLLCTVSSVSVRSLGDSIVNQSSSSTTLPALRTGEGHDPLRDSLRSFSLRGLKSSTSSTTTRNARDQAAAEEVLSHVLGQKVSLPLSSATTTCSKPSGALSFKDMLQKSAAGGEIHLRSLRPP